MTSNLRCTIQANTIKAGPLFEHRMAQLRYRIAASGLAGVLGRAIYRQFAILSASANDRSVGTYSEGDDRALRELLFESGYGFVRLHGLFSYAGTQKACEAMPPGALMVPAISQAAAREFARVGQRSSYIWGKSGQWMLRRTKNDQMLFSGDVTTDFRFAHAAGRHGVGQNSIIPTSLSHPGQYWFYSLQLDHFPPPAGARLYGITADPQSPDLCDALVPLP